LERPFSFFGNGDYATGVTDPAGASFPFDVAETDRLLTTTRAVRKRLDLDRPVERHVILDCLRIAVQAPTMSNSQEWRWVVVTDADKRRQIADTYRKLSAAYLEQASKTADDPQTRRVYESAYELSQILDRVPAMVIPCVESSYNIDSGNAVAAAVYGSVIPATWSFQLALRSRGLGSVFTTFHLFGADKVAAALGIPDSVTQIALLPVAYTKGTEFKPAVRPPVELITYWDAWGHTEYAG
jgi:nitroreductase